MTVFFACFPLYDNCITFLGTYSGVYGILGFYFNEFYVLLFTYSRFPCMGGVKVGLFM